VRVGRERSRDDCRVTFGTIMGPAGWTGPGEGAPGPVVVGGPPPHPDDGTPAGSRGIRRALRQGVRGEPGSRFAPIMLTPSA